MGRWLHAGVAQAVDLGATVIYVLPAGAPCALPGPPRPAIGAALQSLTLSITQRLIQEMSGLSGAVTIKVLPPVCPLAVSAADFGHAAELIARTRRTSLEWIGSGDIDLPAPERLSRSMSTFRLLPATGEPHGQLAIHRA
jgi:NTE family protein